MSAALGGDVLLPPWRELSFRDMRLRGEVYGADLVGVKVSALRFFLSFMASVVLSAGFKYVKSIHMKHLYAIFTGLALLYYPFGADILHLFVPAVLVYLAMAFYRRHCAVIAWVMGFGYLLRCHVASRVSWKGGDVDFTGAMMVLVLKLITASQNYVDSTKDQKRLNDYQRAHAISRLPSPLEWLSYLIAGGNLLAGPHFELADYLAFMERRGPWDPKGPKPPPAHSSIPGLIRLAKALACLAFHLILTQKLSPASLLSDQYMSSPLIVRVAWVIAAGCVYRFKYYFAWAISEAGLIFSGFCFNGYDEKTGRARWDRLANTRIRRVELSTSAAELPAHWNICTGNFLRRYVYERITPPGKKAGFQSMMGTQVVAGVWHGLLPGYALFFVSSAFLFESAKVLFRYERGLPQRLAWVHTNPVTLVLKWLYTAFALNYSASAFMELDWRPAFQVWGSMYYLGHVLMVGLVVLEVIIPPPRPPRKDKAAASTHPSKDIAQSQGGAGGLGGDKEL